MSVLGSLACNMENGVVLSSWIYSVANPTVEKCQKYLARKPGQHVTFHWQCYWKAQPKIAKYLDGAQHTDVAPVGRSAADEERIDLWVPSQ